MNIFQSIISFTVLSFLSINFSSCQSSKIKTMETELKTELPYAQIPAAPENYNAGAMISRTIDGLGFRYYWATEGLRAEDLAYNPGNEGKPSDEVLKHILGLSETLVNAVTHQPNIRPYKKVEMSWEEIRAQTLFNFEKASQEFRKINDDAKISEVKIIFQRGEKKSEFPIWNLLNGQLADAIYHTGQIVSYRRSSGNPTYPGVNVFMGKADVK